MQKDNPLPLIPERWQPHLMCAAAVVSASAVGIAAMHMAGALLAFPLTALLAKMAGEQIQMRWP